MTILTDSLRLVTCELIFGVVVRWERDRISLWKDGEVVCQERGNPRDTDDEGVGIYTVGEQSSCTPRPRRDASCLPQRPCSCGGLTADGSLEFPSLRFQKPLP